MSQNWLYYGGSFQYLTIYRKMASPYSVKNNEVAQRQKRVRIVVTDVRKNLLYLRVVFFLLTN